MKRFFLLLGVICGLYGLSWASNFGSSVDGEQAAVTFTHTADCDSARAEFGYDGNGGADTLNFYTSLQLFPCFSGDGKLLMGEGLDLDSIGTHIVKITYFLDDGDATADGYVAGIWIHKDNLDGVVRYSMPDSILHLRGAHIAGTIAGDIGLEISGYGNSGHGVYVSANGLGANATYFFSAQAAGLYTLGGSHGMHSKGNMGFLAEGTASGGVEVIGYLEGVYIQGGTVGIDIDCIAGDGVSIAKGGAGNYDINLDGDGTIHGTIKVDGGGIDQCTTVTGNVEGNVTGSIGSLATQAKADVDAECDEALTNYDPPTRTEATADKDAIITEVDANETKIDALDDNPWNNALTDTGSGMGDWFADWFNADYWLTATGFSTFDPASDNVAVVDNVTGVARVDSVRKVYIVDSLDQEVSASVSQSDKEDIAEIVKDTAEAHPEIWTDQASGTGADTFNIYVFDADTTAVEGVSITIYNKAHTAVVAPSLITDVNGLVTTFQDADTFHLYLQRLGVIYAQWDTIVVSNEGIDTIWVTAYDPGASPSAHLTRVKGFARDLGYGADERIRITFALHNKNVMDTTQTPAVFVDRKPIVTTFADSFNVDLIPSGSMISKELGVVKDNIKYDVKIEVGGRAILEYFNVFIPGPDTTVWLEDLLE